jgi:glycosyltransferase involved in cell wall biosynthesis
MKISIVTISYNQAPFLEQAILSVLDQKVDLEYIVVDPGSTDGSREIIEKYRHRIHKIIFEKDEGPADGLNKGFAQASGDIFGFLNADDILLPGALSEAADYLIKKPRVDIVSGHGYIIDEHGKRLYKVFSNRLNATTFVKKRYTIGYSSIVQQSTFFRRKAFEKTGGFDRDYRILWDGALFVDFMNLNLKFETTNRYWSEFRIYPNSITGSGSQSDNKALAKYQEMQKRAGFEPIPRSQYPILKYGGWLLEPGLLLKRIIDGMAHPGARTIKIPEPHMGK